MKLPPSSIALKLCEAEGAVAPAAFLDAFLQTPVATASSSATTVGIVGGGASGTLLAAQLLRQTTRPLRILLFDPLPLPEIGTAFTTKDVVHLLNVRAGAMSALPEDPDHFVRWLGAPSNCAPLIGQRAFKADDFVPRAVYARYISHVLEEAVPIGRRVGACFERVHDVVHDFTPRNSSGGVLRTSGGREEDVAHLVLALGNLPPRNPLPQPHAFFRSPRYTSNVWSPGALEQIDANDDLFLAGSGLTMLDAVATLQRRCHRGRITVVSRNGKLPAVHQAAPPYTDFPTFVAWPRTALGWLQLLRGEIDCAAASGGDWRPVFDALRRHTPDIWRSLGLAEKRRFLRHLRPYWESRRHRAAPATWQSFEQFRSSGQLVFRSGRIRDFAEERSGVTVLYQPRGGREVVAVEVHRVLNCIGPESNFRNHINDPLLVSLIARGLVDSDPLMLGLAADPDGAIIGADGLPSTLISTLGPPLRGILWESTAIPEIRRQAAFLAGAILQGLFTPVWEI